MTADHDTLQTPRLLLRRARPEDLQAIHRIMADPEVMAYWSTPPHASLEETRAWLQSMLTADPGQSDEFIVELEGEAIGKVGAWRLPEIGLYLRRDRWGEGYATEALTAYVRHAARRGLPQLVADVDPRNTRCLALLKRLGFVETGRAQATFIVNGLACDSVYLSLELHGHSAALASSGAAPQRSPPAPN